MDRDRDRERNRERNRERDRERGRETERQRDRETERQRDRETERQRDRETERRTCDDCNMLPSNGNRRYKRQIVNHGWQLGAAGPPQEEVCRARRQRARSPREQSTVCAARSLTVNVTARQTTHNERAVRLYLRSLR